MNTPSETVATDGNGQRRQVLTIITAALLLLAVAAFLWWKLVLSVRETTTDAYVAGHEVSISSQVPGTVVAVLVEDTRVVNAGDALVRLDPTDSETRLQQARSALAAAVRATRMQLAGAAETDALVATRRTELANAEAMLARREPLAADATVSTEELADARAAALRAQALLQQAIAQSNGAHAAVDGLPVRSNPAVLQARAAFREAWIIAERNRIVAPVSGRIAQRTAQVGRHVQPGEPLMLIVPEDQLWVDANFKETQLRHLRVGQKARVVVDVYGGGVTYHGHVSGVAAGTGGAFALLPPQNASGNWIKVIQRVPVRIALDPQELRQHPLQIGLSSEVNVDITSAAVPEPPAPIAESNVYALDLARAEAEAEAIVVANLPGGGRSSNGARAEQ